MVLIETLPPLLIVHLKRFPRDTVARGVARSRRLVQFSLELEILPGTFFVSLPRGSQG